ncbi:FUSC family protein [Emticicia sp. BO119]|uniref:FUSC family protein n=1 Tax=Emticicia sp. BO119 TaxID=2757768 RepID=UPI0015F0EAF7|nr:FUSC family protein [Emticicia sp. BO119]MBA4849390.1 FUSC family protein [Emticicia sp. BO119]
MLTKLKYIIQREVGFFFQLRKSERLWHIPVLASICTGLPLLVGYYLGRLDYGTLACMGGLVILYLPSTSLENRLLTLLVCAFGFILSFTVGIAFGFNHYLSAVIIGVYAFGINWLTNYFSVSPPGNFFFVMLASMASCMPFDLMSIPTKIGLLALGTMGGFVFAMVYSLYIIRKHSHKIKDVGYQKRRYINLTESFIIGLFITVSLLTGHLFEFDNPYWIPISCLAIMQGLNVVQVGQRSFHRIVGTFIGMGFSWFLLQLNLSTLQICISIIILQYIIEVLVVRHYALAVIFITPMTVFLVELSRGTGINANQIITARFLDITIGSLIGLIGGWLLHNQKLHQKAERQLRKTRVAILRK